MSTVKEQTPIVEIPASQGAAPVTPVTVFNPFEKLSAEQLTALAGSFNKQWRDAHGMAIALAQTEFQISENDATFYAWLQSEAESVLDRNTVASAVKYIGNMLEGVAFPKSTAVSLGLIETKYNEVKVSLRKTIGIRVRDYATGRWQSVTAQGILDKVYAKLSITEKDWMR
jgi:hypothetical protein